VVEREREEDWAPADGINDWEQSAYDKENALGGLNKRYQINSLQAAT
jgi:hypothetical protein